MTSIPTATHTTPVHHTCMGPLPDLPRKVFSRIYSQKWHLWVNRHMQLDLRWLSRVAAVCIATWDSQLSHPASIHSYLAFLILTNVRIPEMQSNLWYVKDIRSQTSAKIYDTLPNLPVKGLNHGQPVTRSDLHGILMGLYVSSLRQVTLCSETQSYRP